MRYTKTDPPKPMDLAGRLNIRNNAWLLARLDYLWSNFFPDISQDNPVYISFGKYSKFRLGSIKYDPKKGNSQITITAMFKDQNIPVEVVDHTIAHELCHYTHGFSSPKQKMHKYPHSGGVIKRELEERNLGNLYIAYQKWVKIYKIQLQEEAASKIRVRVRRVAPKPTISLKRFW
jgi:hypothetical protein